MSVRVRANTVLCSGCWCALVKVLVVGVVGVGAECKITLEQGSCLGFVKFGVN